jgi:hypothetical protein
VYVVNDIASCCKEIHDGSTDPNLVRILDRNLGLDGAFLAAQEEHARVASRYTAIGNALTTGAQPDDCLLRFVEVLDSVITGNLAASLMLTNLRYPEAASRLEPMVDLEPYRSADVFQHVSPRRA